MKKILFISMLFIIISGCASIEGTRNKSLTISNPSSIIKIDSLAILPIKDNALMPGLSNMVENSLQKNLALKIPGIKIIDAKTFGSLLAKNDLIPAYGQWKAGYEAVPTLDNRSLKTFSNVVNAHYFLMVNSINLSRERIRAIDAGYTGTIRDANNVWRADLKILVELIDATSAKVVWKGLGHAENISSVRKDIDLFFIIQHQKDPGINEFILELIQTASEGIVSEILATDPRLHK